MPLGRKLADIHRRSNSGYECKCLRVLQKTQGGDSCDLRNTAKKGLRMKPTKAELLAELKRAIKVKSTTFLYKGNRWRAAAVVQKETIREAIRELERK